MPISSRSRFSSVWSADGQREAKIVRKDSQPASEGIGIRTERRFIAELDRHWRGPAISFTVGERRYRLGRGESQAEVIVHRPELMRKLWYSPLLTFGEGYMSGEIEVLGSLSSLMQAVHQTKPEEFSPWYYRIASRLMHLPKPVSPRQAVANAQYHYDIGHDFYQLWLDPTLTYSCAYYLHDTDSLATAQEQKLELLCRKVRLAPGQTLLDIGCGWGSLMLHAVRRHGVQATGITPANDQADYIEAVARREGLGDRIRVLRSGWRELSGKFDRIISVGMFEHVGLKQYGDFFQRWHDLLADDGLSLLHNIGRMKPAPFDPWIDRYIFPGGYLPSLTQIASHAADADLYVLDVENLKQHYARTLRAWIENFQAAIEPIRAVRGESFARMWSLYLHSAEAGFRWGELQLWQTVLSRQQQAPWPLDREVRLGASNGKTTVAP